MWTKSCWGDERKWLILQDNYVNKDFFVRGHKEVE